MPAQVRHERAASGRPPFVATTPLAQLHERIAALRIRAEAATQSPESIDRGEILVPVFNLTGDLLEILSPDSDVKRRVAQIQKTLRERGALRLLGAKATPELADAIATLYDSHPNFSQAIDYVLGEEVLARQRNDAVAGVRLLLHGEAGVGKSDFSLSLAKLLGVPCEVRLGL